MPFQQHAVNRDAFAGFDKQDIAAHNLLGRDDCFNAAAQDGRGFGRQVQQLVDRIRRAPLGPRFQKFAKGNQGQDCAGAFKIQVVRKLCDHGRVVMAEAPGNFVQRIDAVKQRSAGPQRNQRIHIRGAVRQGFKALGKIFAVEEGDRQRKQEQRQGIDHRVFCAKEKGGQRPAHHMAHRDIKQRRRKDKTADDPPPHAFIFLFGGGARFGAGCACGRALGRGAVARFFNGGHNAVAVQSMVVIGDRHTVFQQIDAARLYAGQSGNAFFHPGRAGGAGHAGNIVYFLHGKPPFGIYQHPVGVSVFPV